MEGWSLIRPMYHDYPEREEAYACPQQYLFGTDLIVAPYTEPVDPDTRLSRQAFWLPPGDWYHLFSGEPYRGDAWHARYGRLDDVPVFARAGTILPLGPKVGWGGLDNPEELHLHVFAGQDGRFSLYEDAGEGVAYRDGAFAQSRFEQRWDDSSLRLTIFPPSGDTTLIPQERDYHLHFQGMAEPGQVTIMIDGADRAGGWRYDAEREVIDVEPLRLAAGAQARIVIVAAEGMPLLSRRDRTSETVYAMIKEFRMDSLAKVWLASRLEELTANPERLADFGIDLSPSQMRALLEVTQGTGVHLIRDIAEPYLLVVWNNGESAGFRHHFAELRPEKRFGAERYGSSIGATPRFRAIRPSGERWRLVVDYFGLQSMTFHDK